MIKLLPMRAALADPDVFGTILAGESWAVWRILLIAMMGEALTPDERRIFAEVTGREIEPGERVEEFWGIIGRRGGKSRAIAILGSYIAAFCDIQDVLAPGERASLPVMSASMTQATKIFQFFDGIFANVPVFRKLKIGQTADTISLSTRVDIEVRPASFRTIRGGTLISAIGDEVAFWRSDSSANPDAEILAAVRPGIATTDGLLACITSPYSRGGEAWEAFRRHHGPTGDRLVMVAKATSRLMNPTLKQSVVDRAYERDAASASAEFGGEFRNDIAAFLSREVIDAAVVPDRWELPRIEGARYHAFVDPSGGSSDAMTMAVAHREEDLIVLDSLQVQQPPFSPEQTVQAFSEVLKQRYGLTTVTGDRYAGEWPREQFRKCGITYETATKPKSDIYKEALPLFSARQVEILDHKRLHSELVGLERRTARGGRDSIDHRPGAHDDAANAVCGALVLCVQTETHTWSWEPLIF